MCAERCWDELGRGDRYCGDPSSSLADKVKTAAKKDYSPANKKHSKGGPSVSSPVAADHAVITSQHLLCGKQLNIPAR